MNTNKIIFLGDSLTAGYGLEERHSLPTKLEKALQEKGYNVSITNAGVSGDTTAGGLERLDWVLPKDADMLVIALGANDGLRGIDPHSSRENLEKIILKAKEKNKKMDIILIGMLAPPNLGEEYGLVFNAMYHDLSDTYHIPLYPFILEGVVGDATLNQSDGIHPNAKGVEVMVGEMVPFFQKHFEKE